MAHNSDSTPGALRQYVNDMSALDKHILEALERQYDDARVKADAKVYDFVGKSKSLFQRHGNELATHVARLGSGVGDTVKSAVTGALGAFAGLYDKVRKDPVSRMLRDDYVAFNLASISYTMLHTTALAFRDQPLADLALSQLKELTPLIIHANEIVPPAVAAELRDEPGADTSVGAQAVQNTQRAWQG